jgi:TctA family transporter
MRELLEPYFSRIAFTKEQKRKWFRAREGVLFGFGIGFWVLLQVPVVGVLVYGVAEAVGSFLLCSAGRVSMMSCLVRPNRSKQEGASPGQSVICLLAVHPG